MSRRNIRPELDSNDYIDEQDQSDMIDSLLQKDEKSNRFYAVVMSCVGFVCGFLKLLCATLPFNILPFEHAAHEVLRQANISLYAISWLEWMSCSAFIAGGLAMYPDLVKGFIKRWIMLIVSVFSLFVSFVLLLVSRDIFTSIWFMGINSLYLISWFVKWMKSNNRLNIKNTTQIIAYLVLYFEGIKVDPHSILDFNDGEDNEPLQKQKQQQSDQFKVEDNIILKDMINDNNNSYDINKIAIIEGLKYMDESIFNRIEDMVTDKDPYIVKNFIVTYFISTIPNLFSVLPLKKKDMFFNHIFNVLLFKLHNHDVKTEILFKEFIENQDSSMWRIYILKIVEIVNGGIEIFDDAISNGEAIESLDQPNLELFLDWMKRFGEPIVPNLLESIAEKLSRYLMSNSFLDRYPQFTTVMFKFIIEVKPDIIRNSTKNMRWIFRNFQSIIRNKSMEYHKMVIEISKLFLVPPQKEIPEVLAQYFLNDWHALSVLILDTSPSGSQFFLHAAKQLELSEIDVYETISMNSIFKIILENSFFESEREENGEDIEDIYSLGDIDLICQSLDRFIQLKSDIFADYEDVLVNKTLNRFIFNLGYLVQKAIPIFDQFWTILESIKKSIKKVAPNLPSVKKMENLSDYVVKCISDGIKYFGFYHIQLIIEVLSIKGPLKHPEIVLPHLYDSLESFCSDSQQFGDQCDTDFRDHLYELLQFIVTNYPEEINSQSFKRLIVYISYSNQQEFEPKLPAPLIQEEKSTVFSNFLLKHIIISVFNDKHHMKDFHWKISLGFVSKLFFQTVSNLISTETRLTQGVIKSYVPHESKYCLLKRIPYLDGSNIRFIGKNKSDLLKAVKDASLIKVNIDSKISSYSTFINAIKRLVVSTPENTVINNNIKSLKLMDIYVDDAPLIGKFIKKINTNQIECFKANLIEYDDQENLVNLILLIIARNGESLKNISLQVEDYFPRLEEIFISIANLPKNPSHQIKLNRTLIPQSSYPLFLNGTFKLQKFFNKKTAPNINPTQSIDERMDEHYRQHSVGIHYLKHFNPPAQLVKKFYLDRNKYASVKIDAALVLETAMKNTATKKLVIANFEFFGLPFLFKAIEPETIKRTAIESITFEWKKYCNLYYNTVPSNEISISKKVILYRQIYHYLTDQLFEILHSIPSLKQIKFKVANRPSLSIFNPNYSGVIQFGQFKQLHFNHQKYIRDTTVDIKKIDFQRYKDAPNIEFEDSPFGACSYLIYCKV
eukprot:gene4698-5868_t